MDLLLLPDSFWSAVALEKNSVTTKPLLAACFSHDRPDVSEPVVVRRRPGLSTIAAHVIFIKGLKSRLKCPSMNLSELFYTPPTCLVESASSPYLDNLN